MNIKRLVLGTAAGALAVTGAQAADLPVVVEPVDYVRICDAFGVGFFYIPGTETCLRVSGRVRADYNVYFGEGDNDDVGILGGLGFDDDGDDGYRFRARAYIYMDSRTNTEFGLLRAFTEVYFTSQFGRGDASDNGGNGLDTTLNRAFIQFGGLTFGRTQSFYDFLDTYYSAGQTFGPVGISDVTTNLIAYTFAFGNGFSASISLEDEYGRRNGFYNDTLFANVEYQGSRIPDIVGNIRVDQGWGSAQLMAAGHYSEFFDDVGAFQFGGEEEYGFAVGGGVSVNVPFGNGTEVGIQAHYSHGATSYTGMAVADYVITGGPPPIGTDPDFDAVDAWAVNGGFSTNFTPTISLAATAGYGHAEADDYDFDQIDVQGFLGYSPVSGFTLGVGAEYRYIEEDDFGLEQDGSGFTAFFRAQRTY